MLRCKELRNPTICFQVQTETQTTKMFHLLEALPSFFFLRKKTLNKSVPKPVK